MKKLIALSLLSVGLSSCRKSPVSQPDSGKTKIVYHLANRTVKASDPDAMIVDVNADERVDYLYFAQYLANSNGVHLYVGVNPIGNNAVKMDKPNDENFQNMGAASAVTSGKTIGDALLPEKLWSGDFAFLVIRHQDNSGHNTSYEGDWHNGQPYLMPLKLSINGAWHYGWARLSFNRNTEVLTLIDYAWNKNAGQEIQAGAH